MVFLPVVTYLVRSFHENMSAELKIDGLILEGEIGVSNGLITTRLHHGSYTFQLVLQLSCGDMHGANNARMMESLFCTIKMDGR